MGEQSAIVVTGTVEFVERRSPAAAPLKASDLGPPVHKNSEDNIPEP
jgi:hypothetical protein